MNAVANQAPALSRRALRVGGKAVLGSRAVDLSAIRGSVTVLLLVGLSAVEGDSEVVRPDLEGVSAPIVVEESRRSWNLVLTRV